MAKESTGRVLRFPARDEDETALIDFKNRFFSYYNLHRIRHAGRMALNQYYYLGNQWIDWQESTLSETERGYAFRHVNGGLPGSNRDVPTPVTNIIAPSIESEHAALTKRQLIPKVIPTTNDPAAEAAARTAEKILLDRLKKMDWPEIRSSSTLHLILYGTAVIKSYWDTPNTETTRVGSPEACKCTNPECGCTLTSNRFSPDELPEESPLLGMEPDEEGKVATDSCPHCGSEMEGFDVGPEEAEEGQDSFGRPLGMDVPKGNTASEVCSPWDMFYENCGFDVNPRSVKLIGHCAVRHLDWIEERFPGFEVEAENPVDLLKLHPILTDWDAPGVYSSTFDSNVYDCHARVFELVQDKTARFPMGRHVIIINDKVVIDEDLYRTHGKLSVPVVKFHIARWKERPGELYGKALVDDLRSPQNRLNGMDSQIVESRERLGVPHILASEAMDVSGPEWDERGGGAIWRYKSDPLNQNAKPEIFGNQLMNTGVYQERDRMITDMKMIAGPADIEQGEAPKNITTTSGLQLLGEAAERRRSERERGLVSMFEYYWKHVLEMIGVFRVEPDDMDQETDDGKWEVASFDRESIKGQTRLKMEKQAEVDKSLYMREAVREAQADQLIFADSPSAIRRMLELRGLPTDINEKTNYQLDCAKKQWVDYTEKGKIPVIDTTLDDFQIHYDILGTYLISPKGQDVVRANKWEMVVPKIAGWEDVLAQQEQQDMITRRTYGDNPVIAQQEFQRQSGLYEQQMVEYQRLVEASAGTAGQVDPATGQPMPAAGPPPPPMPPPEPFYLPRQKSDRIYKVWLELINQAAMEQRTEPIAGNQITGETSEQIMAAMDSFMRFRAVVDAYRLLAQQAMMPMVPEGPAPPGPTGTPINAAGMSQSNPPNPPNPANPAPVPIA